MHLRRGFEFHLRQPRASTSFVKLQNFVGARDRQQRIVEIASAGKMCFCIRPDTRTGVRGKALP